jgi:signal transduction histidine kinase
MSEIEPAPAQGATDSKSDSVDYRARLEEVADLVARVRHEINNPLTGVLGQAQLLLREDLSERARRRAQSIEELALRLKDIVGELREVQRPPRDE